MDTFRIALFFVIAIRWTSQTSSLAAGDAADPCASYKPPAFYNSYYNSPERKEKAIKALTLRMQDASQALKLAGPSKANHGARLDATKKFKDAACEAIWLRPNDQLKRALTELIDLVKYRLDLDNPQEQLKQQWEEEARQRGQRMLSNYDERVKQEQVEQDQRLKQQQLEQEQRRVVAQQQEQTRQANLAMQQEQSQATLEAFLQQHHAEDLSTYRLALRLYQNPFAYQGKQVLLQGAYHRHIAQGHAIVAIVPARDPTTYVVQWDTPRNLAESSPFLTCIVNVIGTSVVQQGEVQRQIPHVREVACLP